MPENLLASLVQLRLLVGALGERVEWWRSRFTTEVGLRRLAIPFPRTALRAALEGVTLAARRDHDESLGPHDVHLFRLDAIHEDAIAQFLVAGRVEPQRPPESVEEIVRRLEEIGGGTRPRFSPGPTSLGGDARLRQAAGVAELARAYAFAGREGVRVVPYFEGRAGG